MRLLEESYGDVRIFSTRPYGYKRYHVEWADGRKQLYSGLWYSLTTIKERVEKELAVC